MISLHHGEHKPDERMRSSTARPTIGEVTATPGRPRALLVGEPCPGLPVNVVEDVSECGEEKPEREVDANFVRGTD